MADAPADPKDMADMLADIARDMRKSRGEAAPTAAPGDTLRVEMPPPAKDDAAPWLGEIDLFSDEAYVTVTIETRNAEASALRVSVADGRLHVNLGEGVRAMQRDLPLPVPVDEEHAYATFRNGVLDVVLPRRGAVRRGV